MYKIYIKFKIYFEKFYKFHFFFPEEIANSYSSKCFKYFQMLFKKYVLVKDNRFLFFFFARFLRINKQHTLQAAFIK